MTLTTNSNSENKVATSAEEWFHQGRRVLYDPVQKEIVSEKTPHSLSVFERVLATKHNDPGERWITMLPGFPDGSYGWSKVDSLLPQEEKQNPRLYVEYVGQGDSDKPARYNYSTLERADLVEAQWRAHGIRSTVLATFDYSSIVIMELLQRQQDRLANGMVPETRIEHVLAINGGLFADGHSHPWDTTPLLKKPILGSMVTWMAQRSPKVFTTMIAPLFSKEYQVTKEEIHEIRNAITRHNGTSFLSNAAGFVDEHKRNAKRWDLKEIHDKLPSDISFHLVGSEQDQFEYNQIIKARERFAHIKDEAKMKIQTIPGGHMSTSEQAELLAEFIQDLARKPKAQ